MHIFTSNADCILKHSEGEPITIVYHDTNKANSDRITKMHQPITPLISSEYIPLSLAFFDSIRYNECT